MIHLGTKRRRALKVMLPSLVLGAGGAGLAAGVAGVVGLASGRSPPDQAAVVLPLAGPHGGGAWMRVQF